MDLKPWPFIDRELKISNVRNAVDFANLIKLVRRDFAMPSSLTDIFVVSEKRRGNLYRLHLENGDSILDVVLRVNDLYLIGFHGKTGWLELTEKDHKPDTQNVIKNGKFINVCMHYSELRKLGGKTVLGGSYYIAESMKKLKEVDPSEIDHVKRKEIAGALLTIITTFCETLRFNRILEHVAAHFEPGHHGSSAPGWVLDLVLDWGKLSKLVLKYINANEEVVEDLATDKIVGYGFNKEETESVTVKEIRDAVGIVKEKNQNMGEGPSTRGKGASSNRGRKK